MTGGAWISGPDKSILRNFKCPYLHNELFFYCKGVNAMVQSGLEFEILLPQTSKCWDERGVITMLCLWLYLASFPEASFYWVFAMS